LAGGWTTDKGERTKDDGVLEPFEVPLEEAQIMIMTARVQLGWVTAEQLEADAAAAEAELEVDMDAKDTNPTEGKA
jgi:N utilization substance protein A